MNTGDALAVACHLYGARASQWPLPNGYEAPVTWLTGLPRARAPAASGHDEGQRVLERRHPATVPSQVL